MPVALGALAVGLAVLSNAVAAPAAVATSAAVATREAAAGYVPPVVGSVVDPFRPPTTPFGSGNRGVDYATAPGAAVVAPGAGEVTFAGQVGGALHVVVLHPDGIRTTMGFLATVSVHRGEQVRLGDLLGTSAGAVHFGARAGEVYLDPMGLLATGPPRVLLVTDRDRRPAPFELELGAVRRATAGSAIGRLGSAGLRRVVGVVVGGGKAAVSGSRAAFGTARQGDMQGVTVAARFLPVPGGLPVDLVRPGVPVLRWVADLARAVRAASTQSPCTAETVPEPVLRERRIAVLVPGLDSNLHSGFPHALDTRRLGYASSDVEVFSYRGGAQPYEGDETTVDLRVAAARLRQFLAARAALAPGVPIDLIAHSQGGLVVRAALVLPPDPDEAPLPPVAHVVTLASPHGGAPLAGVANALRGAAVGQALLLAHDLLLDGFDARGDSVRQLAPGSALLAELARGQLPPDTRVRTIGGRYDLVVPSGTAGLGGRPDVIVDPAGPARAHSAIASSPAGRREVALALNDLPPGCEGRVDRLLDAIAGRFVRGAEETLRALSGRGVLSRRWGQW